MISIYIYLFMCLSILIVFLDNYSPNKILAYTLHNTLLKSNNKLRINGHKRCLITYQGWEIHIIIDNIDNTESGIYEYLPTNFLSIPINPPDSHSNNKISAHKYTESGCALKSTV